MNNQAIIQGLLLLVGTVVGGYLQWLFSNRSKEWEALHSLKLLRYKAIIILMLGLIQKNGAMKVNEHRADLTSDEDIFDELKTETMNGLLFASTDVISSLRRFLEDPNMETFISTVAAMRKDIGGKNLKIFADDAIGLVKIFDKGYFEQLTETLEKYKKA